MLVTPSKVLIFMLPTVVKRDLVPPPSTQYTIHTVESLDKANANLMMANVETETC